HMLHSFPTRRSSDLNISQPALNKHVRNLENNLDVKLFHRTPSGITLTEAGIHFYNRIKPVMSEIGRIRSELREYSNNHPIAIGRDRKSTRLNSSHVS